MLGPEFFVEFNYGNYCMPKALMMSLGLQLFGRVALYAGTGLQAHLVSLVGPWAGSGDGFLPSQE
jgi:hypothetical protein